MKTGITIQRCLRLVSAGSMISIFAAFLLLMFASTSNNFAQNPIITENAIPVVEDYNDCYQGSCGPFEGFATELGVNKGNTVHFKISGPNGLNYSIKIYRLGYYQGKGARLQATLPGPYVGTNQSSLTTDDLNTGMVSCDGWAESAHWDIPATAVSGLYQAVMLDENGGTSYIIFIVRDDDYHSAMLYKTADANWHAYNRWGGRSFYDGGISGNLGTYNHAVKLSYQRPFDGVTSQNFFGQAELPLIRWMEKNGYDVSYTTQLDMSRDANLSITPAQHKILISAGHDEYWSAENRTVWERARNNGVNLAFFSGNEIYWKTRWEDDMKTLVCFKEGTLGENNCGYGCDPSPLWTGLWRDGCGPTYAGGTIDACNPENQLCGQISWVNGVGTMTVSDTYKNMRFWKNTAIANLPPGGSISLSPNSLGSEWDQYQYASYYPPRRILLSTTQSSGLIHNLSLYRHTSGALVFAAGTIRWSWGLYADHEDGPSVEDINMKQAMVNLFAFMGVPPVAGQLESGLFYETGATSSIPPVSVITSPVHGASLSSSTVTITGTASAPPDAVLFGIEVSVDGGTTWNQASGTTSWSFSWNPPAPGTYTIKARGWDDLGNVEVPGNVPVEFSNCISVSFNGPSVFSVFLPNQPGGDPANGSGLALEVGMRFMSNADGYIISLKYYKIAGTTGVHTGNLWANGGGSTPLVSATFTNETLSGWQTVTLPTPYPITANTLYVVSYFSPSGQYPSSSLNYFTSDIVNGPLTAPAANNGLYIYNTSSAYPGSSTLTNYWVDVTFSTTLGADETPPSVLTISPINNATGVPITIHPSVAFSEPIDPATVSANTFILTGPGNTPVTGTVTYNSGINSATFSPSWPLAFSTTYTAKVIGGTEPCIKDMAGNALPADYTWTFTTEIYVQPSITVHPVSQSTCSGSSVSFSSAATGNPLPSLQWQVSTDGGTTWSDISGATTSPYTFTSVIGDNNKQYRAFWTNGEWSDYSVPATLTVSTGISGSISAVDSDICPGDVFQLQLTETTGQEPFTLIVNGKTYSGVANNTTFATIPSADESIWPSTATPANADETSSTPYELGVKFKPIADGYIKGIRFYKGPNNTGTHIGRLWTATGSSMLEFATFTNETATGWQQVLFSSPVAVTANTTYVASYSVPAGRFSQSLSYFNTNTPVISANGLVQTLPSTGNGVYNGTIGQFPNTVPPLFTNYWVDVVFAYSVNSNTITNSLTSLADNGTCTITGNPVSTVQINIHNTNAPMVNSPVFYSQGDAALPLSATGTYLLWYTTPTGGTGSPDAPTPSTSGTGTSSYYVSQTENGCESPRAQIDVVVTGPAGWYNVNWNYRRPIVLTNSCGTALTDYQILVSLDNTFDFTNPNADGSDIRVTDADGATPIPYWIETWEPLNLLAKIWIKIPSISTGSSTIFIYYGNADATSLSDGTSTFILFDDDWTQPGIWTKIGSPTVLNGIISFASTQSFTSVNSYLAGHALGIKANFKGGANYKWAGFINGAVNPFTVIEVDPLVGTNLILANQLITFKPNVSLGPITNNYHVYELGWLTGETRAYIDHASSPAGIITTDVPVTALPVALNNHLDVTYGMDVDWAYVRKFSNCEPSSITGPEQTMCPPPIPLVSSPVTYCQGATAVALTATGVNLLWYTEPTGGSGSSTAPVPSTTSAGTTSYYVSQTINTCEGPRAQIDVVVNAAPAAPTVTVTEPTCSLPTGTITVTSGITGLSFSIDGVTYTNTIGVFSNVNPGNYNLTAKNSFGCISTATPVTVNEVTGAPPAPTVAVTQPTCLLATGTITITAPTGTGMTYSIDGSTYTNTDGIFAGLGQGNYPVTAKNSEGCISAITNTTINTQPATPDAPSVSLTQPSCSVSTGTITVTAPTGTGMTYSIDGTNYQSGLSFTSLDPGDYFVTAKNTNGCISPSTQVTINSAPALLTGTIAAVNSNLCYGDLYYQLQLTAATGQSPYSLIIDGKTYTGVTEGQTFATLPVYESIWNNTEPGIIPFNDGGSYELGVRFRSAINGYIMGVRFHKSAANTGTHIGSLWTIGGTKLASATFTNETATGWQEVLFDTPVAVTANLVYVASYTDPNGNYDRNINYFTSGVTSGNLYLLSGSDPCPPQSAGNSVYSSPGSFPNSPSGNNYWIDIVFSTWNTAPVTLTSNLTSITDANGCSNSGNPLSSASVTINPTPNGTLVSAGTVCAGSNMSLTFNATSGTGPFALIVNGNTYPNISSGASFNVGTTGTAPAQSIWPNGVGLTQNADVASVELGVKFRSNTPGQITGIRFYKSALQAGTFTGTLWTSGGTNLASAIFTTTTSGWQQVYFTTPVTIQPNVTYVASYHAPNGRYYSEVNYFLSSGVTNGALTALQTGIDGVNGVYVYSPSTAFPNQPPGNTNYWVDVVFVPFTNNYFELTSIISTNGCIKTGNPINNVSVPVNPSPIASASSNSPVIAGSPLNLSSGPAGMVSYLWSGPNGYIATVAYPVLNPVQVSNSGTFTVTVTDGNGCSGNASTDVIVTESNAIVSGNIIYFNTATTPLQNVNIKLQQNSVDKYITAPTGSLGEFTFTNVAPGTYDVVASSGNTAGGINVTDAAQTNYWGVFFGGIEKVRFYAGDVVMNNMIDGTDASRILQYFLTQGSSGWAGRTEWTFWNIGETIGSNPAPAGYPSIIVSGSNVTQNLYALVTGDFNQSFVPGGMKAVSESLALIYGETISVIPDLDFDLPLSAAMDMEVGAVSLIMEFPSDLLEVNGVFLSDDPNAPLMHSVSGDELRIGWNSLEPVILLEGESLLTLKVKLIGLPGEEGIRFKLAADPLNELADGDYNVINNAVLSIDVITSSMTGTGEISLSDRLTLANHPNPFNGKTTFAYSLPVDGKVTLEIYDIVGNKVKSLVDVTQSAGDYVLSLDETTLQPGVYTATIKLKNNDNLMTRTIKIISKQ